MRRVVVYFLLFISFHLSSTLLSFKANSEFLRPLSLKRSSACQGSLYFLLPLSSHSLIILDVQLIASGQDFVNITRMKLPSAKIICPKEKSKTSISENTRSTGCAHCYFSSVMILWLIQPDPWFWVLQAWDRHLLPSERIPNSCYAFQLFQEFPNVWLLLFGI